MNERAGLKLIVCLFTALMALVGCTAAGLDSGPSPAEPAADQAQTNEAVDLPAAVAPVSPGIALPDIVGRYLGRVRLTKPDVDQAKTSATGAGRSDTAAVLVVPLTLDAVAADHLTRIRQAEAGLAGCWLDRIESDVLGRYLGARLSCEP